MAPIAIDRETLEKLVRCWQERHGLRVDGILGPKTSASLNPPDGLAHGVLPIVLHADKQGKPAISDGFGRNKRQGRGHLGVDLMYRRAKSGREARPAYTKHFYCPTGLVEALACAAGEVVRVVDSAKHGVAVYVQHGRYMSVYRHLTGPVMGKGCMVEAGDALGTVSHAPSAGKRGINHLHFEIWDTDKHSTGRWDREAQAIDPEPFLKRWGAL